MKTLFVVALVLEGLLGLGFVVAPNTVLAPFGVTLDRTALPVAGVLGSALLAVAVLAWFALRPGATSVGHAAVRALCTYYLVSAAVFVNALRAGLMGSAGWSLVAVHLVLVVWCGYFIVKAQRAGASRPLTGGPDVAHGTR